jgi:hypothetical protein
MRIVALFLTSMNLPLLANFNAEHLSDRLESVSQWLLDELYATEDDLSRPTVSGYTSGAPPSDASGAESLRRQFRVAIQV